MTTAIKKPIYLFYGEDTYSSFQKIQLWKREFEKKYGDFNMHVFDGENFDIEEFISAMESVPFLSEKKLIIVRDFLRDGEDEDQKKIAVRLEKIADFCVIVFIEKKMPDARTMLFKKLKQIGYSQEFQLLEGKELANWIQKKMEKQKTHISSREIVFLAETVGPNLWQMNNEIEKLTLYRAGEPIQITDIEGLTSPNLNASIFRLTDYLGQKNSKLAIKTLHTLLESGESILGIFFMIVRHFRLLIKIRACLDQNMVKSEIIQKTKEKPRPVAISMNQSKNFNPESLREIYGKLLQIDFDLKGGKIRTTVNDYSEMQLALENFIVGYLSKPDS